MILAIVMDMHQEKARLPCLSPLLMLTLRLQEQQTQVHLLQSLVPFEQWRTLNFNEQAAVTVVPPIAFTKCLAGIISDSGPARINYGFNASTLQAYAPAGVKDIVCCIVMLGY